MSHENDVEQSDNERRNRLETVVLSESVSTLNNILLYAICARIFSDSEIDRIIDIWKPHAATGLAHILQDEEKTRQIIQSAEHHVKDMLDRTRAMPNKRD